MQGHMQNGEPWPQEVEDAYNEADRAIRAMFAAVWRAQEDDKPGDMITDWVLGVHYIDLEIEASQGYAFESSAKAPHSIIGLFDQCSGEVQRVWDGVNEDDE